VRAVLDEVDAVEAACHEHGWEPVRVAFDPRFDPSGSRADVVFNLVEGRDEPVAARLLATAGRPFTGSEAQALLLAQQKPLARSALAEAGVPIPRGCVLSTAADPIDGVRFPVIVKPSREDASHGIATESVVEDEAAARDRARTIIERYRQPALLEEFVAGRELGVSLLGAGEETVVLPLAEIAFVDGARLLTYAAKWLPGSAEYVATLPVPCDEADPRVSATAIAAWKAIGGRDYGRVDVRLSPAGEPFVIDVNPNADLSPDAGFARAAARMGVEYADLVGRIVEGALARAAAPASA
jgi:D-alanine-D-alanine ligase